MKCWKLVSGREGLTQYAKEGHWLNSHDFLKDMLGVKEANEYMQSGKVAEHAITDLHFQTDEQQEIDMDNVSNAEVVLVIIIGRLPRWFNCKANVHFNKDGCWITDEEVERHM